MRSYEAARGLFSFLGFVAWSVVVIGVLVALIGAGSVGRYASGGAGLLAMIPGVAIGVSGFILVAFVQMGRATVDTAEYTQQMLKIARDQLDISKQGLNRGKVVEQGFAAAKQPTEDNSTASFADTKDAKPTKQQKLKAEPKIETRPAVATLGEGEKLTHQGHEITRKRGMFVVKGSSFDSLQMAKRHVENALR